MTITINVSDARASGDAADTLVTYSLGSCIGVCLYDPVARVAGLLHYQLPTSTMDPAKADNNPFMFADTGIPLLFRTAYGLGAEKRRLVVRIAGGAQVMDENGTFNIGKRNHLALRRMLWKAGVIIHGEEIGGTQSRTVRLEIDTGRFWIRGPGMTDREMPVSSQKEGVYGASCPDRR